MRTLYEKIEGLLEQVPFEDICAGFGRCDFAIYDSGHVWMSQEVILWDRRFVGNTAIDFEGEYIAIFYVEDPQQVDAGYQSPQVRGKDTALSEHAESCGSDISGYTPDVLHHRSHVWPGLRGWSRTGSNTGTAGGVPTTQGRADRGISESGACGEKGRIPDLRCGYDPMNMIDSTFGFMPIPNMPCMENSAYVHLALSKHYIEIL